MHLNPLHLLLVSIAGGMNREQDAVIEHLQEENRVDLLLYRDARHDPALAPEVHRHEG
jgi:hypothetical protein